MVEFNYEMLNHNDLAHSFFCMDRDDPTIGFEYSALSAYGPTYPKKLNQPQHSLMTMDEADQALRMKLIIGSHLARHLRHELEAQKGYTATVGIATNKLLSKLVGNVNKPENQTTIMPPYEGIPDSDGPIIEFMDSHDIGKVPGIGFKLAQKIREQVLGREPEFHGGLVYGGTKEQVDVQKVRLSPGMCPELLEEILGGPGSQKGIGGKVWALLHGVDDTEVGKAKRVPSQISQEDSYMKYLHTFEQVRQQLFLLSDRLIRRMRIDLTEEDAVDDHKSCRWLAHPRTLRLSTRPRPPTNADGIRPRTFHRISRSAPMPNFVFNSSDSAPTLADRLVDEALVPMFRKLHPQRSGWNLSLINIAVTNMTESAADTKDSEGRDIGKMFRRQDDVLRDFRVTDVEVSQEEEDRTPDDNDEKHNGEDVAVGEHISETQEEWHSDVEDSDEAVQHQCRFCHATIPLFAADAHERFHIMSA